MKTRLVTLAGDGDREASLAIALSGRSDVELLLRCVDRVELLGAIRSGRVDAIVSAGQPEWFDRQCRAEAALAGARVVMVGPTDRAGWPEGTVVLPYDAAVDEIVAFAMDSPPIAGESKLIDEDREGHVVAVWGPKGAPGRTRIAIELACQVSSRDEPAFLVDADPYGGDVSQLLGLVEELPTIIWASRLAAKGGLTKSEIGRELRRIGSDGPVALPGLPRAELWAEISDFAWSELIHVARQYFPYSVVDVGFCFEPPAGPAALDRNRMARATLQSSDRIIAVCHPDPVGVKNFIWAFEELCEFVPNVPVSVLLNRAHAKQAKEAAALIKRHLRRNVAAVVPDLNGVIANALTRGLAAREVDRDGDLAAAMETLAVLIGAPMRSRGLMARLAGAAR